MGRVVAALLAAVATVAAAAQPSGDAAGTSAIRPVASHPTAVASNEAGDPALAGVPGADDLGALAPGVLPPPPKVVVRQTSYFGAITIDHAAHLARGAKCNRCHDPGMITKILFTPKIAHDRCIGCHREAQAGPQKCQGCHVKPPPTPEQLAAAAKADEPPKPPPPPEPDPANVASALAEFDRPADWHKSEPFMRHVEVGVAVGDGAGISVRYAAHHDFWVVTESVESLRMQGQGRTMVLGAVGICDPGSPRRVFEASAVAGLDLVDGAVTALLPAVGLRGGVEWRQPAPFMQSLHASVTCLFDLSQTSLGHQVGGAQIYFTVGTGFRIP